MQKYIFKQLHDNNINFIQINKYNALKKIYDLFKKNIILDDFELDGICSTYYSLYFYINKDYNKFIRYSLIAIDKKEIYSMYFLGCYYESINNIKEAKKYFILGANHNCENSIKKIAYFLYKESEWSLSIHYYKILQNLGDINASYILGKIYDKIDDKINAIKYYMIAYDNGHDKAINKMVKKIINAFDIMVKEKTKNHIFDYICELILKIEDYETKK